MVGGCRPEVLTEGRRNRSRDDALQIRCRAAVHRIHRTVMVSNEVPYYRGARQYYLRTCLLAYPAIPEII
jgi:hypothetical protein